MKLNRGLGANLGRHLMLSFLIAFIALVAAAPRARAASMDAHFIDVGQGAATLLEFSCGGDPARDFPNMTALEHGHPRVGTVTRLINNTSGTRPTKQVPVADGVETFHNIPASKAVYATGWDGTVLITAFDDGTFGVITST